MSDWFTAPLVPRAQVPELIIRQSIEQHNPVRIFACFSSGNDSLISTHIAMRNGAHEVFNVNTTIGLPEAREHFYAMCEKFRWNHRVKFPPDRDYETMVMEDGFPGPGAHIYPYSWLKERAIRELVAESKVAVHDRVMLITGVRKP
jgi:3'-phosphoadenosine 5'-phosphosulfate sulfotransferase (PAPS reductase)/FAD synthetase